MLHYRTETAQLLSPGQGPGLLLLLLTDDLPPDLPAQGQLGALGRFYLPEDGEDLVPGKVWQSLLILLESCWQERDWLVNDNRSTDHQVVTQYDIQLNRTVNTDT